MSMSEVLEFRVPQLTCLADRPALLHREELDPAVGASVRGGEAMVAHDLQAFLAEDMPAGIELDSVMDVPVRLTDTDRAVLDILALDWLGQGVDVDARTNELERDIFEFSTSRHLPDPLFRCVEDGLRSIHFRTTTTAPMKDPAQATTQTKAGWRTGIGVREVTF
jgi:hypothetical protein